ncbi:hypothetical protein CR513_56285, partial [Mucuna pruriens]
MKNEYWQKAIDTELLALDENQTWDIVPCPPIIKPLGNKLLQDLINVLGNKQEYGLDCDETFAPVPR